MTRLQIDELCVTQTHLTKQKHFCITKQCQNEKYFESALFTLSGEEGAEA